VIIVWQVNGNSTIVREEEFKIFKCLVTVYMVVKLCLDY